MTDQLSLADDPATKRTGKVTIKKPPLRRGGFYFIPKEGEPNTTEQFDSVTAALSEVAKPALVSWAARQAAASALEDPSQSVTDAAASIYRTNTEAKLRGSTIHAWVEAYVQGVPFTVEDLPEEIAGYARAFERWLGQTQPKLLYSELTVFNRTLRYAGTLDMIGEDQSGHRFLGDVKTGKGVYEEAAYQMAAYRHCDDALDPVTYDTYTLPATDYAQVIHLKADGTFAIHEMADNFTEFLAYLHLYRARSGRACPAVCFCHGPQKADS